MNQIVSKFWKFVFVGGCATAIHYTILMLLVEGLEINPVLATTVGFVTSAALNYSINRRFTFESSARHVAALPKFMTVALLGAAMNAGIVGWFAGYTNVHYVASQVCATIAVLLWNFAANAIWTFRKAE
jgi:putative flippase GtrA